MPSREDYIRASLELNLFFGRIMKEHLIFMEVAFMPKNKEHILEADKLKEEIENLLLDVIKLSNGVISPEVLNSEELVTPLTLESEKTTEFYTGVDINTKITKLESELESFDPDFRFTRELEREVYRINERAINLVSKVIRFKEDLIDEILNCKIFITLYFLFIDHILREARLYLRMLIEIQDSIRNRRGILREEIFWNTIMEEHALFIRGLLDPTEADLINTANDFANIFHELIEEAEEGRPSIPEFTRESLEATIGIKDFKTQATEGIIDCEIKSIAYPLLGDHVLREANHYIRLLRSFR